MRTRRPQSIRLVSACLVVLIAGASLLSSWHYHKDRIFHDDCPICRFQVEGNSTLPDAAVEVFTPAIACSEQIAALHVVARKAPLWSWRLPNAPPVS